MFGPEVLDLDYDAEVEAIVAGMRQAVRRALHRRGAVVAISGGIDSSVVCALAVRAFGPDRVLGLMLPERDSSPRSAELATMLATDLGIETITEDIAPALAALGCYERFDAAVAGVVPGYGPGWKCKLANANDLLDHAGLNYFRLIAEDPQGETTACRLPTRAYLEIVAATNFKQRVRKTIEYHHADRLHYAVMGTPNRLEYDQGFFVKNGDGAADVKPIAHLYKSQVYAMARHLGLRDEVCDTVPTTDTFSLDQGQDEFYFLLPYRQMDLLLWALNHGVPAEEAAPAVGLTPEQVGRVFQDIERKRKTTRPLHLAPILVRPVPEGGG